MATLKELREQLQEPRYKKMKKLHVFTKYIYSQAATPIIKVLLKTSVTGNQVTIFWVSLGVFSCLLLSLGQYWVTVAAVVLLHLHLVLDYVDGPIARARKQTSLRGIYIERVGHQQKRNDKKSLCIRGLIAHDLHHTCCNQNTK